MDVSLEMSPTRRLLIVSDSLVSGLGGVVRSQAEWFTDRGWKVYVAAKGSGSIVLPVEIDVIPIPHTLKRLGDVLRAVLGLRDLLRTLSPDVIHCHGLRSSVIAALAGRRAIVHIHGSGPATEESALYTRVRRLALRIVPPFTRWAISADPSVEGWDFLPDVSPRLSTLNVLPFPTGRVPTFLWLGTLEERKRPDVFIRAISSVGRTTEVRGLIAGSGHLRAELEALARELEAPVQFLGHRTDIAALLQESWALAVFSTFEGMPLTVGEAMWAGRPVVGSRIRPLEWLVDGTGYLVTTLDETTAAFRELTDPSVAAQLGHEAANRVRKLLPLGTPWPAVERFYESQLRSR